MTAFALTALSLVVSSALGLLAGLAFRSLSHRANDRLLAVAAGMMLGASIVGLIVPALDTAGRLAFPLTAAGVFAGALVAGGIDRLVPFLQRLAGRDLARRDGRARRAILLVAAIALHKFPEGIAAGVSLGAGDTGDLVTVVGSLSLQNVPEALVVVAPLLAVGVSRRRTFLVSLVIGLVSLSGLLVGSLAVRLAGPFAPFFLAAAGGAMLYVVAHEMIPETHHAEPQAATHLLLAGFLAILFLSRLV